MSFPITLTRQEDGQYQYENTSFFPIDNRLLGNQERIHNYHFTLELSNVFTYQGGETFSFSGDDDVFVYINNQKVIDIGGVHSKMDASVTLDDIAEEIGLEVGEDYYLDFFFAERHTTKSNFILTTNIQFEELIYAD